MTEPTPAPTANYVAVCTCFPDKDDKALYRLTPSCPVHGEKPDVTVTTSEPTVMGEFGGIKIATDPSIPVGEFRIRKAPATQPVGDEIEKAVTEILQDAGVMRFEYARARFLALIEKRVAEAMALNEEATQGFRTSMVLYEDEQKRRLAAEAQLDALRSATPLTAEEALHLLQLLTGHSKLAAEPRIVLAEKLQRLRSLSVGTPDNKEG